MAFFLRLALVLFACQGLATLELLQDPTLNIRLSPWFEVSFQEPSEQPVLKRLQSFGLVAEVPVLPWLNSGFIVQINSDFKTLQPIIDLSPLFKFQIPMPLESGHFTPYVLVPFGVSFIPKPALLIHAQPDFKPYDTGFGLNAACLVGAEYFPISYLGFFADIGYKANLFLHHLITQKEETQTWNYASYWMHGWILSFGVKIAF